MGWIYNHSTSDRGVEFGSISARRPLEMNDEQAEGKWWQPRYSCRTNYEPLVGSSGLVFRCCRFHSMAFATHPAISTVLTASSASH